VLAAHYLKLKDYYGRFDNKTLKKIREMQNTPISLNTIRETYGGRQVEAKKRREAIFESLYGDVGDVDNSKYDKRNIGSEVIEEKQKTDKFIQQTKERVQEIINIDNFEPEKFYQELVDLRHKKLMDREYGTAKELVFTEMMKERFPGIEEKFNDMKAKKMNLWTFEKELDKAALE